MKRSQALAHLSRDHQHALAVALRLRRATPASLSEAVAGLFAYLESEGERHFELEERHVLPALPADDPEWETIRVRILDEHQALRAGAEELRRDASPEGARALGQLLAQHVRFEERVAFPLLEDRLSVIALERLGLTLSDD